MMFAAYSHAIGLRAIHVTKEEIPKLDWIDSSEEESELARI